MTNFYIHNIVEETAVHLGARTLCPGFYFSPHDHLWPYRLTFSVTGPFDSETEALIACCKQENADSEKPSISVSLTRGCPSWVSKRKPHSHLAGYVTERKHPLGGHLVIYDRTKDGQAALDEIGKAEDGLLQRWYIIWENSPLGRDRDADGFFGPMFGPDFRSLTLAREFYKNQATGEGLQWNWEGGHYEERLSDAQVAQLNELAPKP